MDSLPPKERALFSNCDSPEELIKDLENFNLKVKNRGRILACMTRVKTFNDALSPYFEVVSIAIQSHPEIAAIAWGTLRLVLQVRTNINQNNEILYLAIGTLYERNNTLLNHSK